MSVEAFNAAHAMGDTDFEQSSMHHTIGAGPTQAASGDHLHDDAYIQPSELDAQLGSYYTKVAADGKFALGQNVQFSLTNANLPSEFPVGITVGHAYSATQGWPATNGTFVVHKSVASGTRTVQTFTELLTGHQWVRHGNATGDGWGAWIDNSLGDTGWVTGWAAAGSTANWPLANITNTKYRILNGWCEVRFSTANDAIKDFSTYTNGDHPDQTIITGMPVGARPSNGSEGMARWRGVPVSAVLSAAGDIVLTGGPPSPPAYAIGTSVSGRFIYTIG